MEALTAAIDAASIRGDGCSRRDTHGDCCAKIGRADWFVIWRVIRRDLRGEMPAVGIEA
jgi:hypothetical protein